jgi:hypothetical protein
MSLPRPTDPTPRLDAGLTVLGFVVAVAAAYDLLGDPLYGLAPETHVLFLGAVFVFLVGFVRLVAHVFAISVTPSDIVRVSRGEHTPPEE